MYSQCIFVANQKAVCIGLKYVEFHLRLDRSLSENGDLPRSKNPARRYI